MISTDISLELTLPQAETPAIIWVWECKNLQRKVSVDDVEEFDSKLQQIGANNTKGTLISRNGFQTSAAELSLAVKA